jgi:hypothetical protein
MAADTNPDEEFYEEDEPLDKIRAAFERGPQGTTGRVGAPLAVSTDFGRVTVTDIRLRQGTIRVGHSRYVRISA